jgi:putative ABC transport system permease protein
MISIPLLITITFCLFLHTRFGLKLRAMGVNPTLLQRLKQPTDRYLGIGLAISNALAAASGVLTAEVNNYADINMGLGMALTAIGSIIIGLTLIHRFNPLKDRFYALIDGLGSFSGIFLYFLVMNVLIVSGLPPIHLKLLLGITLIVFLGIAQRQQEVTV